MRWSVDALALVVVTVMLGSAIFATFSSIAACLVKTRERFMGISTLMASGRPGFASGHRPTARSDAIARSDHSEVIQTALPVVLP